MEKSHISIKVWGITPAVEVSSPRKKIKNKCSITKTNQQNVPQPKQEKVIHFVWNQSPKFGGSTKVVINSSNVHFELSNHISLSHELFLRHHLANKFTKCIWFFYMNFSWGSDKRNSWKIVSIMMRWTSVSTHKEAPVRLKSKMECYEEAANSSHHRNIKSQEVHTWEIGSDKEQPTMWMTSIILMIISQRTWSPQNCLIFHETCFFVCWT